MKNLKINKWIKDIHRIFIPRSTKEANKRFDYAERIINFPENYFNRVKNQLNKYGQIDSGYVNKNTKDKEDGMILSKHHKRIVRDGYEEISSYGIKRYSEMLAEEFGLNWDGIRKEIGLMKRYGVI